MIGRWISQLFSGSEGVTAESKVALAAMVEGNVTSAGLPLGKMLCAFSEGRLTSFYCDQLPAGRKSDEWWWLVPCDDLELKLTLPMEESTVAVAGKIRFEPESELWSLLEGREGLTKEDLASLVTSQLGGLVDSLGLNEGDKLLELDELERERLRARLSLLLQSRGLRCTELGEFTSVPVEDAAMEAEVLEVEEQAGGSEQPQKDDEVVWAEILEEVNTADDWEGVMASIESAGVNVDETTAGQLYELGEAVVDRQVQAKQVAARMKQMLAESKQQVRVSDAEVRRMRGLDLRLDTLGGSTAATQKAGGPQIETKRRPWTWWMLNRKRVDERLLRFLNDTVDQLRTALDAYRSTVKVGPELVELRRIDKELQMTVDLLETVPTLAPKRPDFRLDRKKIKELVGSVERAVTNAEVALAHCGELQRAELGDDDWLATCGDICSALDRLNEELRQRRMVRET